MDFGCFFLRLRSCKNDELMKLKRTKETKTTAVCFGIEVCGLLDVFSCDICRLYDGCCVSRARMREESAAGCVLDGFQAKAKKNGGYVFFFVVMRRLRLYLYLFCCYHISGDLISIEILAKTP